MCIYTTKLELILPKIPENWKIAARFARGMTHPAAPLLGFNSEKLERGRNKSLKKNPLDIDCGKD